MVVFFAFELGQVVLFLGTTPLDAEFWFVMLVQEFSALVRNTGVQDLVEAAVFCTTISAERSIRRTIEATADNFGELVYARVHAKGEAPGKELRPDFAPSDVLEEGVESQEAAETAFLFADRLIAFEHLAPSDDANATEAGVDAACTRRAYLLCLTDVDSTASLESAAGMRGSRTTFISGKFFQYI